MCSNLKPPRHLDSTRPGITRPEHNESALRRAADIEADSEGSPRRAKSGLMRCSKATYSITSNGRLMSGLQLPADAAIAYALFGLARRSPSIRRQETQDVIALSRNGFQDSASRVASSSCPSSNNFPTVLKYSQRNDGSGNS